MSDYDVKQALVEITGQMGRIMNATIKRAADEGAQAAVEFLAGQIADCDAMTGEVEADYLRWRARPDCDVPAGVAFLSLPTMLSPHDHDPDHRFESLVDYVAHLVKDHGIRESPQLWRSDRDALDDLHTWSHGRREGE